MTRRCLIPLAVLAFCLSLTARAGAQVGITATPQFPAPAQNVTIEAGAYSGSNFTCEPPVCLGMYSWVVVNGSNGFYRFAESWSDFAYLAPTNDSEPGQSMQPATYTAYGGVVWNICTQLNTWVEPWICEASEPFYEVDAAYASVTPSAQISSLSLSPSSGGGPRTTFEFVYSSAAGPGDIQQTWQILHATGQTSQSCVVGLYAPTFVVLWGDQGWQDQVSAWLGDATVLENSQCRLHLATSSSSTSGNTRTVRLDVSFKPGYFGSKNVYMYGLNAAGTYSSPSLGGTWTARSQLNSATPSPAVLGQTITLAGVELGSTGTVKFTTSSGSVDGTVVSPGWSSTGIPVTVPSTAVSGHVWVVVNGQASNTTSLTVETGPVISNVSPRWGPATMTTPITITGVNFGTTAGTVTWGGTAVAHATWSATSVTLQLPSGASTAQLKIVRAGVESNPFPFEVGEDGIEYIHTDGIGSVRVVTGHEGIVLERHDYRPFGEELGGRTSLSAFAGGQQDGETATTSSLPMDYFGARHLAAALGRFTTVDPGHADGTLTDPQSWNGYAYVRNNPLTFVDPDGRQTYIVGGGELVAGEGGGMSDEDRGIWSLTFGRAFADSLSQAGAEYARMLDKLNQVTEPVRQFITAPRDPQCMATAAQGFMAIGGTAGGIVGALGGAGTGAAGGTLVAPGFGTLGGGFAGGAAGAANGAALGTAVGGAAGSAVGAVKCMTAANVGNSGGGGPRRYGNGRIARSETQRKLFLTQIADDPATPSWMKPWLRMGKTPPGYIVDHRIALSAGGADVPANMRLMTQADHVFHHRFYHPWR